MKYDLNVAWRYINDVCFGGEMAKPTILAFSGPLWSANKELLVGCYHPNSGEILLHVGSYGDHHEGGILESLYHEMVHQYIDEVLGDDGHYKDHGKVFWEVYGEGLRKLNNKRGLISKIKQCQYTKQKAALSGASLVRHIKQKLGQTGKPEPFMQAGIGTQVKGYGQEEEDK